MNSENTLKNKATQAYSFQRGYGKAKRKDYKNLRSDIMEALGITTLTAFDGRRNGKVIPKVSEVPIIEAVFAKYGIRDIWGAE